MTDLARIEIDRRGPVCLVRIWGEIDLSNAADLASTVETAMPNSARELVVDLTGTSYLDSVGVALLLRLSKRLRSRRQDMRLVVPEGNPVRAVLELTGVPKLLPVDARLGEEGAIADAD